MVIAESDLHEEDCNLPCQVVDLEALRELAWSGIPAELRPVCWQLLLGYLPPNRERRYTRTSLHARLSEPLCPVCCGSCCLAANRKPPNQ